MKIFSQQDNRKKKKILSSIIFFVFTIFFFRLFQLQWIYYSEFEEQSTENSIRKIVTEATRGLIYDKNNILIVDNRPSYTLTITPNEFKKNTIKQLAKLLSLEENFILNQYNTAKKYNPYIPFRLKRNVDFETLSKFEEIKNDFPGIDYQIETKRFYNTIANCSHLLGYLKEIDEKQLTHLSSMYKQGDLIGGLGIESTYEPFLRGQPGIEFISINAFGQVVENFEEGKNNIAPKEGNDLIFGIDIRLQELAESLMTNKKGAIVAIDPNNGEVLTFLSKPDFDLKWFGAGKISTENWKYLNNNDEKPLFNRTTLTRYPPGSTYKMLLACAALESGIINEHWRIQCGGSFTYGNHVFHDMHVHGSVNVVEAIQKSCNVFFFKLMLMTGFDKWTKMGERFGFGKKTGIDIDEESSGLLPSHELFDKMYGKKKWTLGYTISLGIGQGELGVTPIQMANYCAAIANYGTYFQPHIVKKIVNRKTKKEYNIDFKKYEVGLKKNVLNIVREGMFHVVETAGGTGGAARINKTHSAGKTGTAQNSHGEDHAWYIGFAPYENPKIAVCILIENGGKGGAAAAPIAKQMFDLYLKDEIKKNIITDTTNNMAKY